MPASVRGQSRPSIQNFCVVTPNVLWRGARPDKDGAAWLIQHGVRTIVNLELIHDDKSVLGQATSNKLGTGIDILISRESGGFNQYMNTRPSFPRS